MSIKIKGKNVTNNIHEEYRTIQINKPFINNNDISKLSLSEQQVIQITTNDIINLLYDFENNLLGFLY
jgi:hypothetical protein